jgi:hypothetical protein
MKKLKFQVVEIFGKVHPALLGIGLRVHTHGMK